MSLVKLSKSYPEYQKYAQNPQLARRVEIESMYKYAKKKELKMLNTLKMHQSFKIPSDFDYAKQVFHFNFPTVHDYYDRILMIF